LDPGVSSFNSAFGDIWLYDYLYSKALYLSAKAAPLAFRPRARQRRWSRSTDQSLSEMGEAMRKGEAHSALARQRISEGKKLTPDERLQKDRDLLRLMGPVHSWEFAERVNCSEKSAVYRLRYLYDAGYATRTTDRRSRGYTYEVKS